MQKYLTVLSTLIILQACGETTQSEGLFSNLKDGQTHYERLAEVYESAGMPDESVFHETKYLIGKYVDVKSQNYVRDIPFLIYQAGDPVIGMQVYLQAFSEGALEEDAIEYVKSEIRHELIDPAYPDVNLGAWVTKKNYRDNRGSTFVRAAVIAGSTYLVAKAVCEEEAGCDWRNVDPAYKEVGYYTYTKL